MLLQTVNIVDVDFRIQNFVTKMALPFEVMLDSFHEGLLVVFFGVFPQCNSGGEVFVADLAS